MKKILLLLTCALISIMLVSCGEKKESKDRKNNKCTEITWGVSQDQLVKINGTPKSVKKNWVTYSDTLFGDCDAHYIFTSDNKLALITFMYNVENLTDDEIYKKMMALKSDVLKKFPSTKASIDDESIKNDFYSEGVIRIDFDDVKYLDQTCILYIGARAYGSDPSKNYLYVAFHDIRQNKIFKSDFSS